MTQPPDERDPGLGSLSGAPSEPTAQRPTPEAPTQAWAPPPGAPPPPIPNQLTSAEPAAPGPVVGWAAPVVAPQEVAPGLTWSDTGSRFVAYVLDSVLVYIVAIIVLSVVGIEQLPSEPGAAADTRLGQYAAVLTAVLGAAYFILSWSGGRRATPGQRLLKIQVGNAFDGRPLTTTQAIKRWVGLGTFIGVFAVIPGREALGAVSLVQIVWEVVLLVSTTTSPTKQGLHDRFANSALVRPVGAGKGMATTCLFLVVALFGLALLAIIALIFLGGQVSQILSSVGTSI